MIKVSDRAGRAIEETRKAKGLDERKIMRLCVGQAGKLRLRADDPKSSDNIIKHSDGAVLAIDKGLEARLPDSVIDVKDTPRGLRLRIRKLRAA